MRPEDAPAREVPVPQSAAAAVERGVDAAAHGVVDQVGLARARRLPVEGEAEDQQHEAGGGRERDGQRGVGAPGGERVVAALVDRQLAVRAFQRAYGGERAGAVGQRDFEHAGVGAEDGEGLGFAQDVEQPAADNAGRRRRRRDHEAIRIADKDLPAGSGGARRARLVELVLRALPGAAGVA